MARLSDKIELVEIDYMTSSVKAMFLRDYATLPTPGGIISVRRGEEVDLPRWQALMLASKGIVDIKDEKLDLDRINMYHFREVKRSAANQLAELPRDFYLKVRDLISMLNEVIKTNPSHMVFREREVVETNVTQLAEKRLTKIIRLAQAGGGDMRDKLTTEEAILYNEMSRAIEEWRSFIRSLFPLG